MKSFHIKSILLGIGIGTILTAIISIIFLAGYNPSSAQLTNQEIKDKAKSLGMLDAKSILAVSGTTDTKLINDGSTNIISTKNDKDGTSQKELTNTLATTNKETTNKETTNKETTNKDNPTPPPATPEPEKTISVIKGDTSEAVAEKLFSANLIQDKKAFIDELTKMGLTMEINIGQYKIKKGMDIKVIIKMLTTLS